MKDIHNRNYHRINDSLIDAYNELLIKKGTPDFSITDLCNKAKINRTTFYKHYQGIHEITDQLENDLIYHLFDHDKTTRLGIKDFLENPAPSLERLNANLLKDLDYYKRLVRPDRTREIESKLTAILYNNFKEDNPDLINNPRVMLLAKLNILNFVGSVVNLYTSWFSNYIKCDISEISKYLTTVLTYVYKNRTKPEDLTKIK